MEMMRLMCVAYECLERIMSPPDLDRINSVTIDTEDEDAGIPARLFVDYANEKREIYELDEQLNVFAYYATVYFG